MRERHPIVSKLRKVEKHIWTTGISVLYLCLLLIDQKTTYVEKIPINIRRCCSNADRFQF